MGRRRKEKAERSAKVAELLEDVRGYIDKASPPIVHEFAHLHGITGKELRALADSELNEGRPELDRMLTWLREAKEISIEKGALDGTFKTTAAVFSLKALGWTVSGGDEDDGGGDAPGIVLLGDPDLSEG